jgi:hypothetical protein
MQTRGQQPLVLGISPGARSLTFSIGPNAGRKECHAGLKGGGTNGGKCLENLTTVPAPLRTLEIRKNYWHEELPQQTEAFMQRTHSAIGRTMHRWFQYCLLLLCSSLLLIGQTTIRKKPASDTSNQQKDIDPLVLKVLKAVTDPIRGAKAFSFRTRGIREYLGSNGRIITYFTTSEVTVGRPDKLRVDFKGRRQQVQLYYDGGQTVLYAPGPKLYAVIPIRTKTLDGVLQELEKRGDDPYQTLLPDIKTGYVIGQVDMYGKQVHQLAFTEKDAEYQLWVTGEPDPRIQGLEIVYKALPHEPRVMIEFSDWNLNPQIQADTFSFKKPANAKQIDFLQFPR